MAVPPPAVTITTGTEVMRVEVGRWVATPEVQVTVHVAAVQVVPVLPSETMVIGQEEQMVVVARLGLSNAVTVSTTTIVEVEVAA